MNPLYLYSDAVSQVGILWTNASIMATGTQVSFELETLYLDDADAISEVQCVLFLYEADESLLVAFGANQSVDLESLDTVNAEDSILDLLLGGFDVTQEGQGIETFNLLHASLAGER